MIYLGVAIGGGLGALLRFYIGRLMVNVSWLGFPYATFTVNAIGSFLIGYLAISIEQKWGLSNDVRQMVIAGFLGGFTTFSAFSLESLAIIDQGHYLKAAAYIGVQVFVCVLLCAMGAMLAKLSIS